MAFATRPCSRTTCTRRSLVIANNKNPKKIDLKKQGLESVSDKAVQNNLKGVSDNMKDKNWRDASGRPGVHCYGIKCS